jgi:multidrug efflux pump subunit AcrB
MTAVILSLGGAFFGLLFIRSPFGIIMTGVGVISLAGVVVNNGIVLVDYINKLRERGFSINDAIIAGGATRLRPVILTAITTILGLIPMVTGVSFDFHIWEISWVSESTQWWRSMAIVVIFGLMISTFLTLLVVPTLYSLLEAFQSNIVHIIEFMRRMYWKPYEWLTGETVNTKKD